MQITDLVSFNGAPPIDNQWSSVSVHRCEEEDYDMKSEDNILVGLLVSIKHHSTTSSNNIKLRFGGIAQNSSSRGSTFAKLRGGNMNATYDRLFFFADLNTPGKCFVILTETVNKSDLLMSYAQHSVGVGDIFAIIEPDQVVRSLQGDLPLINTSKALYPLLNSGFASVVPLVVPEVGKQRYFYLKKVSVELSKVEAVKATCNGTLCDRQNPILRTGSCGCLYYNRTCSIVLDMTVTFKTTDSNGYENQYSVPHFRSWRTSQVFIHPTAMTADSAVFLEHTREIRNVAANIKNIVNQNEGWTIVGWYRKGEIVDASAEPNDAGSEITSDNHPIHVSYLYPTKPSCLDDVRRYPRGEDATTGGGDATTGTAN
jgi:hypothetical protein